MAPALDGCDGSGGLVEHPQGMITSPTFSTVGSQIALYGHSYDPIVAPGGSCRRVGAWTAS